ncbi:uncharacterized protein LOC120367851 [Saimiri boliviensis]|uniref:uncharacterized protein LOC120367851 n=1 Tax=Saimiri boliviensis TaxID=27679 RepID=UPI003D77B4C5
MNGKAQSTHPSRTPKETPAAPTHPRPKVWRKPRGWEGGGAAALGDVREGGKGRLRREEAGHSRGSRSRSRRRRRRYRPLSFFGLRYPAPAPAPAPLARFAALTATRAPQPRALPSASTTDARGGGGTRSGSPQLGPARHSVPGPGLSHVSVYREGLDDTSTRSPQPHPETARLPRRKGSPHPPSQALERSRASAGTGERRVQGRA